MITAGIDVGSTTTKVVLLNEQSIAGELIVPSGTIPAKTAQESFDRCCTQSNINPSDISAVAATGYGRRLAKFGDMIITEIKACGLGALSIQSPHGKIATIIDIGGQDTKVISLNEDGSIANFAMNDKCAAGTGRFLEMLATKLSLTYEQFIDASLHSKTMIQMNSTCAVFAESEVISLLARNIDKADIAAAAHNAIAERISSMVRRVSTKEVICLAGGGAKNKALALAIEEALNKKVFIPESPQTIVALGAAIAARNKILKGENDED